MLKNMTRTRLIQIWFAVVVVAIVIGVVAGAMPTATTAAMLLALCLVPPAIVMLLWPGIQPPTVGDVLRGTDRK
jgi:spore maturation protein SpmA